MADTDISSHGGSLTDPESATKRHATIEQDAQNGDSSDVKYTEVSQAVGLEDEAAIPKGTIDPVYEAKARVLNHAVRPKIFFRAKC